jgi:hypothetical protein
MTAWNLTATKWGGNKSPPDIPGGGLVNLLWNIFKTVFVIWDMQTWTSANAVHYAMMAGSQTQPTFGGSGAISSQFDAAKQWKFNTNGYISAKLEWQIKPTVMLTKNFMDTRFDNKKFRTFDTLTLRDQASPDGLHLIVDHWNLQDGRPIQGGKGNDHGTAYWKQLERMAFVNPTSKGIAKGFATAAVVILDAVTMLCLQVPLTVDPMETVLTSKPYAGSPGTRSIDVDQGDKIFDTSPYVGAYKNAYQQRGDNFMGCPQPEIIGCNRSLSSNNPFGEFIITGEGGSGGSP